MRSRGATMSKTNEHKRLDSEAKNVLAERIPETHLTIIYILNLPRDVRSALHEES